MKGYRRGGELTKEEVDVVWRKKELRRGKEADLYTKYQ